MAAICRCALFLALFHLITSEVTQDDLIVTTKDGKVKGRLVNGDVRAFLGIPYGKPPLGKLRFRPAEPVARWEGVKHALGFSDSCYQTPDVLFPGFAGAEMWNPNTYLSEDCLYLNVWSPHVNKTLNQPPPLAPVLVWIYGGGFTQGTSSLDIYNGYFLSKSESVVVVSMNYRLGALGFLSFPNNENIKGNAGLLDQRLALKWVAHNIAAFGGDPSKVTLFGESAGSASVGFHLLSPGSQELFERAVMQSGSPNAPWATTSPAVAWERSLELATNLGCPTSPPARLETCMQLVDVRKILREQDNILTPSITAFPFLPHSDKSFLPDDVDVLLNNGNLPKKDLMVGLNKDEGTFFVAYAVPGFTTYGENLMTRKQFLDVVELAMTADSEVTKNAAIFQYTDWADETNKVKNRDSLGSLIGDQSFTCPVLEFAHRYSQNGGKTYMYFFDHRSSVNTWPEWMGVMHGYEIEFVFGMPLNPSLGYTKNEVNMTRKIMKHWANFARTGNPEINGAKWPLFTNEQEYVTLNSNDISLKRMMRPKECQLWNHLVPQLQNISDKLLSCVNGSGTISCCSYISFLILVTLILTF